MARQQDASAGRQRLVTFAAVAALAGATAFTFGRVFVGRIPTWGLIAAALASVTIAAMCERRGLLIALLASATGLAFAITWVVLPQTAWYGLPTLRTLRALGRCLEFVAQQARVQVAPTQPLPPLMLAALTATWTAAFSTHALAVRAGAPLLAVLPSVALVGFADMVLDDGARPVYAIVFLLSVLAVVFVDGLRRVREWGPVWATFRTGRAAIVSTGGARRVATIAVLAALLIPGLLPGFRAQALVDFSTSGEGGLRLDPFVSIYASLDPDQEPVDLFEVTSSGGDAYWRLYSLDRFNGTDWTSSDPLAERGLLLTSPARLQELPVSAERFDQRFRILGDLDDTPWLPMAYPAETVTLPEGELRFDYGLGTAVLEGGLHEGLEYSVTSGVVAPTPQELDAVRFGAATDYGTYTFVPSGVDPGVERLARRWTREEPSPYRQILAIQRHLRDPGAFSYSLDVEPTSDADALLEFLTETRRGFCQQFATAMAVLVRKLGYPARVAVGFRSGPSDGNTYVVNSRGAHAWVEVFFPGYGWLPFEPTPGRTNPVADSGTYLNPSPVGDGFGSTPGADAIRGQTGSVTCLPTPGGAPGDTCIVDPVVDRRLGGAAGGSALPPGFLRTIGPEVAPAEEEGGYSIPYRLILLGLLVIALALLVLVPIGKGLWRHRLLRGTREPRELVLGAYRVFDGEAADLGLGRREGETLEEQRARLTSTVSLSDGHLARLTGSAARAAYAAEPPSQEEAREAVRDARAAIGDLRRDAGWIRRIVGTYRPGL